MHQAEYTGRQIKIIRLASIGIALVIVVRLLNLQIVSFARFFTLGQRNFLRTELTTPARGSILDCKNRPLATSRPVLSLFWQGTGNSSFTSEQQAALNYVLALIKPVHNSQHDSQEDSQAATTTTLLELLRAEKTKKRYLLASDIPFKLVSALTERYTSHANIKVTTHFKRVYPHKKYACHLLGYLGSLNHNEGQMGLERLYESVLQGKPGTVQKTVNSKGHVLLEKELIKPVKGQDLVTTLDLDLQAIAENVFPSSYAGVVLGLSPINGALKFVVSRPGFNPNTFLSPFGTKAWSAFKNQKQPFINRAFNAVYPPASLFKLVTISAALEQGVVDPEGLWVCTGSVSFAGRRYYCSNRRGHGEINTKQAVSQSCNIPFYEIAKNIKIDVLADYAHKLGLGTKTGASLPEKTGLIPTSAWKMAHKKERWWPGETLSAAIGQSFLLATPLQLARMVSAICTGYFVKPCILVSELEENNQLQEPLQLKPDTLEFLKRSMSMSVREGGTSKKLNQFNDLLIYAKTGTAQTSGLDKRHKGEKYREHGWFVAYIQYKNYEPITLLVLLENAGSSTFATDTAKHFLLQYYALLDRSP